MEIQAEQIEFGYDVNKLTKRPSLGHCWVEIQDDHTSLRLENYIKDRSEEIANTGYE